jgi:hypothetical protein
MLLNLVPSRMTVLKRTVVHYYEINNSLGRLIWLIKLFYQTNLWLCSKQKGTILNRSQAAE